MALLLTMSAGSFIIYHRDPPGNVVLRPGRASAGGRLEGGCRLDGMQLLRETSCTNRCRIQRLPAKLTQLSMLKRCIADFHVRLAGHLQTTRGLHGLSAVPSIGPNAQRLKNQTSASHNRSRHLPHLATWQRAIQGRFLGDLKGAFNCAVPFKVSDRRPAVSGRASSAKMCLRPGELLAFPRTWMLRREPRVFEVVAPIFLWFRAAGVKAARWSGRAGPWQGTQSQVHI